MDTPYFFVRVLRVLVPMTTRSISLAYLCIASNSQSVYLYILMYVTRTVVPGIMIYIRRSSQRDWMAAVLQHGMYIFPRDWTLCVEELLPVNLGPSYIYYDVYNIMTGCFLYRGNICYNACSQIDFTWYSHSFSKSKSVEPRCRIPRISFRLPSRPMRTKS